MAEDDARVALNAQYQAQEAAKRAAGRYTIDEAARLLEVEAGERYEVMLRKLTDAASAGMLRMYEPSRRARYEYGDGPGKTSRVRDFYEEVYWDELNRWLIANEPLVSFRFHVPVANAELQSTNNVLYPLETVASQLSVELWPDTVDKQVLARETYRMKYPNKLEPLLNGQASGLAFLASAREDARKEIQEAIEALLSAGELPLLSPSTFHPTRDRESAWVNKATLTLLMTDGRHLRNTRDAAEAGVDGSTTRPPVERRWTPEALESLRQHRAAHGTKVTAAHYRISPQRIRELLPKEKPTPKGYSVFNPGKKET